MKKFFRENWLLVVMAILLVCAIIFGAYLIKVYASTFKEVFPVALSVQPVKPTQASTTTESDEPTTTLPDRAHWGTMGDYFGGLLNPIFSLLGVFMLLITLFQNQKELALSRKELKKSNKALGKQAETLEKQRFEDTFFSMLDQLNKTLDKIVSERISYRGADKPENIGSIVDRTKESLFGRHWDFLLNNSGPSLIRESKEYLLGVDPTLNQYFRILYQVLKFVSTNSPVTLLAGRFEISILENTKASDSEKFYSNIVRSCVPENVYYLLGVNCFVEGGDDAYYPYKLLVERYAFFEHMPLDTFAVYNQKLVHEIILHYEKNAFGTSADYATYGQKVIREAEDKLLAPVDF
jgi:hypothetical protein